MMRSTVRCNNFKNNFESVGRLCARHADAPTYLYRKVSAWSVHAYICVILKREMNFFFTTDDIIMFSVTAT